jgi:3-isopropylmalate dehydrogenase
MKIAILPGDGIGTEIVAEAVKVLNALDMKFEMETALVGGAAYDAHGHPLPDSTLKLAKEADAILFGAVGDWKYDTLDRPFAPRASHFGFAQKPGVVCQLSPCYLLQRAGERLQLEARVDRRFGHPHHPRADRRHLLWPTTRPPRLA